MRVVPGGTVLVSGVRMTVLWGREGMSGGQEAGGKREVSMRLKMYTGTVVVCNYILSTP